MESLKLTDKRTSSPRNISNPNSGAAQTRWWADSPMEKYWMEVVVDTWGNKLVAPEHSRHAIMHDVQIGDVVFHWVGKNNTRGLTPGLYGYSTVASELKRDSGTWKNEKANEIALAGYTEFSSPIYLEEIRDHSDEIIKILESLRKTNSKTLYFPFQEHKGFGVKPNQRYLTKFPVDLVMALPDLKIAHTPHDPIPEPNEMTTRVGSGASLFEPALEKFLAESAFAQTVRHYERKGYKVETAAEGLPFDLIATREEDERHLLVTWSHEEIEKITISRTACEHATALRQTDLVLVSSIPWHRHSDGRITTGTGFLSVLTRWLPETARLRPLNFEYSINDALRR